MKESIRAAREEIALDGIVEDISAIVGEDDEDVGALAELKAQRLPPAVRAMTQLELLRNVTAKLRARHESLKDPGEPLDESTVKMLADNGYDSMEAIRDAPDGALLDIKGIGNAKLEEIREKVG